MSRQLGNKRSEPITAAFLRDRDVACVSCGYNLRGCTLTVCPECQTPLHMRWLRPAWSRRIVKLIKPVVPPLVVGCVASAIGAGALKGVGGVPLAMVGIVLALAQAAVLAWVLVHAERYAALPTTTRRVIVFSSYAVATVVVLGLLLWVSIVAGK